MEPIELYIPLELVNDVEVKEEEQPTKVCGFLEPTEVEAVFCGSCAACCYLVMVALWFLYTLDALYSCT